MPFEKNIFINCPFDKKYKPMLRTLVFGCVYMGYKPLIAENINSAESRLSRIQNLISNAKFSIHDLSRKESSRKGELARFNMPFELGVDMGCKVFGGKRVSDKSFLILDKERYRYQKALSDISGNDIEIHKDNPQVALRKLRNWINNFKNNQLDSPGRIWRLYNEFNGDFYQLVKKNEWSDEDIEEMRWDEFCYFIEKWLEGRENFDKS